MTSDSGSMASRRLVGCELKEMINPTKEMMQPCLIYLQAISLVPLSDSGSMASQGGTNPKTWHAGR